MATPVSFPKPRKPVAVATKGKLITEYRVIFDDEPRGREVGVALGATQAEARAKAVAIMEKDTAITELRVVPVVRREDGDDTVVRITRPMPETATVGVKLTLHAPKKGAQPTTFMVVFATHT
jgi:hypothetical protein